MQKSPRHGYTTGACAAAAAKGAALMLRDQKRVESVAIDLPAGIHVSFALHGQSFSRDGARCFVVKDAGDDPDVTNGCAVWAEVTPLQGGGVSISGGTGIGRVTKPGLAVAVGEWAINPVPRRMIEVALREVYPAAPALAVTISIPDGEERAKRTLNARLGILGGLSILGTSGIVKPISHQAWTDTLDAALDVAVACGCTTIVLSTGRTSEATVQPHCSLPEEACVMMGDHLGYALRACARRQVPELILAGQFAKLLKIACGHEQTHVAASTLDLVTLAGWLEGAGASQVEVERCRRANTAREVLDGATDHDLLVDLVCTRARNFAQILAPGSEIKVFLAGYRGEMLYFR